MLLLLFFSPFIPFHAANFLLAFILGHLRLAFVRIIYTYLRAGAGVYDEYGSDNVRANGTAVELLYPTDGARPNGGPLAHREFLSSFNIVVWSTGLRVSRRREPRFLDNSQRRTYLLRSKIIIKCAEVTLLSFVIYRPIRDPRQRETVFRHPFILSLRRSY